MTNVTNGYESRNNVRSVTWLHNQIHVKQATYKIWQKRFRQAMAVDSFSSIGNSIKIAPRMRCELDFSLR